jgi:hypothetical protein
LLRSYLMPKQLSMFDRWVRDISELAWQKQLMQLAHTCGWRWCHLPAVLRVRPGTNEAWHTTPQDGDLGFPDLILLHPSGVAAFLELKSWARRLHVSQGQVAWIRGLQNAGLVAAVATPYDDRLIRTFLQDRHIDPFRAAYNGLGLAEPRLYLQPTVDADPEIVSNLRARLDAPVKVNVRRPVQRSPRVGSGTATRRTARPVRRPS